MLRVVHLRLVVQHVLLAFLVPTRLTENLQVVDRHQDARKLCDLLKLLVGCFFLVGFNFLLALVNVLKLCIQLCNVVVQFHDLRVHGLLIHYDAVLNFSQTRLL